MKKNSGIKTAGMVFGTMIIAGTLIFCLSLLASGDESKEELKKKVICKV